MGGEAGRAPSGGLRSCACSRTGWGRHHHHHVKGGCGAVRSVSLQHVPWAGDVRSSAVRVIGAGEGAACPQRYEGGC